MATGRRNPTFAAGVAAVARAIVQACRTAASLVRPTREAGTRSIPPIVTVPGGECPGQPLGLILYTLDDGAAPHGVDVRDWWPTRNELESSELRTGDLT
jgi:hypothetical protein